MDYKWIGALLIIAGCGGFGFYLAAIHRREEQNLRRLICALDYMTCELRFRMTPLPELCRNAARESAGIIRQILTRLSLELETCLSADVSGCMLAVMQDFSDIPVYSRNNVMLLGECLGRFDLEGQLQGLEAVRSACRRDLETLTNDRDTRLRGYQTLGLCAGAALAIVLI